MVGFVRCGQHDRIGHHIGITVAQVVRVPFVQVVDDEQAVIRPARSKHHLPAEPRSGRQQQKRQRGRRRGQDSRAAHRPALRRRTCQPWRRHQQHARRTLDSRTPTATLPVPASSAIMPDSTIDASSVSRSRASGRESVAVTAPTSAGSIVSPTNRCGC